MVTIEIKENLEIDLTSINCSGGSLYYIINTIDANLRAALKQASIARQMAGQYEELTSVEDIEGHICNALNLLEQIK